MMKTQKGMAIITVMLIIALMTILAVAGQREWVNAMRRVDTLQFQQQARWTLLDAEKILLKRVTIMNSNEPVQKIQLEDLQLSYRWRDRQSCFNVNALGAVAPPHEGTTHPPPVAHRIFLRLLERFDVKSEECIELLNMIRRYINPNEDYKWAHLSDKTELRALTEQHWSKLSTILCALPDNALRININAISDQEIPLMVAVLGNVLDDVEVSRLFKQRPENGWTNTDDFITLLPETAKSAVSDLQSVAVTTSQHWEFMAWIADEKRFAAIRSQFVHDNG
ncbi:type II secretion system minor pseudopilin GspK, partial [Pantoea endophytica]